MHSVARKYINPINTALCPEKDQEFACGNVEMGNAEWAAVFEHLWSDGSRFIRMGQKVVAPDVDSMARNTCGELRCLGDT